MARSRRTSPLDDLITILARLPWWVSLIIGLLAWLILNPIANRPMPVLTHVTPNDMSGIVSGQLLRTFASAGQYLIPILCMVGALGSLITRARRKKLMTDVQSATQPGKAIDGLSWQQFEQLISEAFLRQGYSVTETGGNGPDGGVDVILHRAGEKYLVQCKHWRALKVGVPVIREFFGAMAAEGAAGGFVVISGQFTNEAKAFADGRNITLIDGKALNRWIAPVRDTARAQQPIVAQRTSTYSSVAIQPVCPVCSSAMVTRTAKRGPNAGNAFWGCNQYPRCRGVVNI